MKNLTSLKKNIHSRAGHCRSTKRGSQPTKVYSLSILWDSIYTDSCVLSWLESLVSYISMLEAFKLGLTFRYLFDQEWCLNVLLILRVCVFNGRYIYLDILRNMYVFRNIYI